MKSLATTLPSTLRTALVAIGLLALAAGMQSARAAEMPSRIQGGGAQAVQSLRLNEVPAVDVRIAPSAKQLFDAARSATPDGAVPSVAELIGIKRSENPSAPRRVGSVFSVTNVAVSPVQWTALADGGSVAHVRVGSAGAVGIRAKLRLPAGLTVGEIRVTSTSGVVGVVPLHAADQGVIWTPYTDGDTQIVEIYARQNVANTDVKVLDIAHFEESLNTAGGPGVPAQTVAAGACSPDVVCGSGNAAIDAAIASRKKSVARINFMSGGGAFLCTGTLINSSSQQNFFLTANHCISTQAEAASIESRWFYESTTCGGGAAAANPANVTLAGGAQLVFTNQFVDSTLLRLNLNPPAGAIFAAWNSAEMTPSGSVISISHPKGDVMKYALGANTVVGRTDGLIRLRGYEQPMYGVLFNKGVIEGGSSGSGIFTLSGGELQLRGVLSSSVVNGAGESLSCAVPDLNANYGRLSYFYPQIAPLLAGTALPVDDHVNQPGVTATTLPLNGSVAGTLSYVGDLDVFKINVTQPGTLYAYSSSNGDLIGNLMDANGATLETNDDASADSTDFGISWQVNPGTYYLSVAPWTPTELPAGGYTIATKFTTATTNFTSLWWNAAESGWGMNVNHQGNTMFATMFNFESKGQGTQNPPMWLTATLNRIGTTSSFTGDVLRVTGPAFNAVPFTPIGAANVTRVGSMRIDFTDANNARLTYDVNGADTGGTGAAVTKAMTRQAFGTLPVCGFSGTDRSANDENFQDLWWNPNESGWGVNFTHQDDIIFASLFTYEAGGAGNFNKGMWLVSAMNRGAGDAYQGDLLRVTGPAFNAVPFTPITGANSTRVGNMRVAFTDGNAATLTYDVNGQSVTKAIQRQVFDNFRPDCREPRNSDD